MCGEKDKAKEMGATTKGSPPRVRGKGADHLRSEVCLGITPAYAGKSYWSPLYSAAAWDHPRVCGEKCPPGKFFFMTVGSPPRMRGKAVEMKLAGTVHGITPACTGKSYRAEYECGLSEDHPRVCGEKVWALARSVSALGSPPRVRGKVPSGRYY